MKYSYLSGKNIKILNYHAAIQFIIHVVLNTTFNNITVLWQSAFKMEPGEQGLEITVAERILLSFIVTCLLCCHSLQQATCTCWKPPHMVLEIPSSIYCLGRAWKCGGDIKLVNGIQTNQKSQRSLQLAEMCPGLTIFSWDSPRVSIFRFLQLWRRALNICTCTSLFTGVTFS